MPSARHTGVVITALAVAVTGQPTAWAAEPSPVPSSVAEPDDVVPQAPEAAPTATEPTPESAPNPTVPDPTPTLTPATNPVPPTDAARIGGATCADPSLRRSPACAEYRKWSTISYVGWPTMLVSWGVAATISGAALQRDNKLGAIGLFPVVGAPISAVAGDWSIEARIGLGLTGAFQIAGLVLGIVGAVKARRAANPRVSASPTGLMLRF